MFFFKALTALALATAAAAQSASLQFTNTDFDVQAGKPFTITYKSDQLAQSATILLRRGPSNSLTTVETITSEATGGSYSWTPSSSLPSASDYAFQITQGSEDNYSEQFSITGGSASTATPYGSITTSSSPASTLVPTYNTSSMPVMTVPSNYSTSAYPSGTAYSTGAIPMSRNATFSMATIRPTSVTPAVTTGAPGATSTSHPNAASSVTGSFALVFSIFAAMIFLN